MDDGRYTFCWTWLETEREYKSNLSSLAEDNVRRHRRVLFLFAIMKCSIHDSYAFHYLQLYLEEHAHTSSFFWLISIPNYAQTCRAYIHLKFNTVKMRKSKLYDTFILRDGRATSSEYLMATTTTTTTGYMMTATTIGNMTMDEDDDDGWWWRWWMMMKMMIRRM